MLLGEAFDKFLEEYCFDRGMVKSTLDNYKFALNCLLVVTGNIDVYLITLDHIRNMHHCMEEKNQVRNGIVSYLYKMRLFFRWLAKIQELSFDPNDIIIPKRVQNIPDYLTVEEIQRLMRVADTRERAIIALFHSTGMRVSELCQVRTKDVKGSFLKVRGKGSVERQVQIDSSARHYINAYLKTRTDGCPFLFYSKKKGGLTKHGVQFLIRGVADKAGIDKVVSPKVFRHSTATDLLMNGCNLRYIQVYLGHADISTTQIYTHVADKEATEAYNKFHKKLTIIT